MLPRQNPDRNDLGEDVTDRVPAPSAAIGVHELRPLDERIWVLAAPALKVRDNDVHSLYAYGIASALLDVLPDADPDIVLPAVLLHDIGWSTVPLPEIMQALRPGARSSEASLAVVRRHEVEGARLATEILEALDVPATSVATIARMIDGHDTRLEALSLDDAILKDADKVWRVTPAGIEVVMDWFGLTREESHRLNAHRTHDHLFTDAARSMARVLSAVAWVDCSPQRAALG
ncbi:MAG TPA: HD domain-containing protein [Acidimicrobiales bacterium]|nr:HD domain-containing protein [Actinomycetes bacterium]HVN51374.1 HD domain-containing protein [Acidimicrobiales bacterium]